MDNKFSCPRANCEWRRGEMCVHRIPFGITHRAHSRYFNKMLCRGFATTNLWVSCPYAKKGEKEEEEDAD